jgi:ABC-type hemin transport system substrate-binding protein
VILSVCGQLTADVQHVKKSDCQAIIDARPTVFLTMSDRYDHDVQKALLDLVNQSEKVLEDEKEVRIRSEEL